MNFLDPPKMFEEGFREQMRTSQLVDVGGSIKLLRTAVGLGQSDLAQRAGLSTGTLSMIENGRALVPEAQRRALATILDCLPEFFASGISSYVFTRPWLRAYADAPKRDLDQFIADSLVATAVFDQMNLQRIPASLPLFTGDLNDDEEIETFAGEVRSSAGIEPGEVVKNCIRAAERLGCVVLPMGDELGRHLGLSLWIDSTPLIRVTRPAADDQVFPGDRRRFTVAHELGHLSLHHHSPPPNSAEESARLERQASRFAGAFLLPADPLIADLDRLGGRLTLTQLSKLKAIWGVAIKALVVRFGQLGVLGPDHARSLYKQISARGWNKGEPVIVGQEVALWLTGALRNNDRSRSPAGRRLVNESFMARWANWSPIGHPQGGNGTVSRLGTRQETTLPSPQAASILRLPVRN